MPNSAHETGRRVLDIDLLHRVSFLLQLVWMRIVAGVDSLALQSGRIQTHQWPQQGHRRKQAKTSNFSGFHVMKVS